VPILTLNGRQVDVDIRYELEQFEWTQPTWTDERLLAASPFRYDRTPSFYVYLDDTATAKAGYWGDSGYYDAEYARGGFVKLLAFLREETEEETVEYLIDAYAPESEDGKLTLRLPKLKIAKNREPLSESILDDVSAGPNDYLNGRGIMTAVQRLMGVGMAGGAVALPWRLPNGRLANVKYRSTRGKAFWYVKGGWPIRGLVYGMNVVYDRRLTRVVLCEAEIDAQSWMTAGVPAIGTGGSSFNQRKADIIVQSPIEHVTIVTDNDKAGEKLRAEVERYLYGKVGLAHGYITEGKDANEFLLAKGRAELKAVYERAEDVKKWRLKLQYGNTRTKGRRRLY